MWPPAYGSCLGVGEKALLRHTKPVFLFTICLPDGICLKRLNNLNLQEILAGYWQRVFDLPVLTVFDEFIVPEELHGIVKEQTFTTSTDCEVCDHYSLMNQIKNL